MRACRFGFLLCVACLTSCGPIIIPPTLSPDDRRHADEARKRRADLEMLAGWMTGSFSTADQALADPDFQNIQLHTMRMWEERTDGPWLYVEQAAAKTPDRPYRQRVYRLSVQPNGLVKCDILTLPGEPRRFAGAWKLPRLIEDLGPKDLTLKEGCTVVLKKASPTEFTGGTVGEGCASDLNGAAYATSEVSITPDGLSSLDRGFDKSGKQVWGPATGPYVFRR